MCSANVCLRRTIWGGSCGVSAPVRPACDGWQGGRREKRETHPCLPGESGGGPL